MIRELFQHPSQVGRPSFPTRGVEGFRSYVKDSILKYELEEDEGTEDQEYRSEWEMEIDPLPEGISIIAEEGSDDGDLVEKV